MSNSAVKLKIDVNSVEDAVNLILEIMPVKSLSIVHNVIAGSILGEVKRVDHEQELAAGVTYLVIGVGKLPTGYERGIHFVNLPKDES